MPYLNTSFYNENKDLLKLIKDRKLNFTLGNAILNLFYVGSTDSELEKIGTLLYVTELLSQECVDISCDLEAKFKERYQLESEFNVQQSLDKDLLSFDYEQPTNFSDFVKEEIKKDDVKYSRKELRNLVSIIKHRINEPFYELEKDFEHIFPTRELRTFVNFIQDNKELTIDQIIDYVPHIFKDTIKLDLSNYSSCTYTQKPLIIENGEIKKFNRCDKEIDEAIKRMREYELNA